MSVRWKRSPFASSFNSHHFPCKPNRTSTPKKAKMKFSSAISLLLVGSAAAFAPASTSQSRGTVSQFFPSAHPNYQAPNAQQPKDWRVATSDPALVVDERHSIFGVKSVLYVKSPRCEPSYCWISEESLWMPSFLDSST